MHSYNRKLGIVFTASSVFYTEGEGKFIDIFGETRFRPGVLPILRRLHREKYSIYIVCNVGEVLDNIFSLDSLHDFYEYIQDILEQRNIKLVQIYYECNLNSRRALPHPTMIKEVLEDFQYTNTDILLVGRDYIDYQAASRGNFDYWYADDFFNTLVPKRVNTY